MSDSKEFYRNYLADNETSRLSTRLIIEINALNPNHVLEFGCGTGKHGNFIGNYCGIDLSLQNVIHAMVRNNCPMVIKGDETNLRHLCNFDVVFTCSVLDHIEEVEAIIGEFVRISNKAIFLAETNDVPDRFYYPHDYESMGFQKLEFKWKSPSDGAIYHIWKLEK